MNILSEKVLGIAVGLTLGLVSTFATKYPEARASETSDSMPRHSAPAELTSSIELGPSQRARCNSAAPNDQSGIENCAAAGRLLALMNAESRDKVWANKMEADLTRWSESFASKGVTLRNVECRLSWCMVEVASGEERPFLMRARDERKWNVFHMLSLFAPDIDDPKVLDTVMILKRYCKSIEEILDYQGHVIPNFNAAGKKC